MAAAGTSFRNEVRGKAKVKEREKERESKKGGGLSSGWLNCAPQSHGGS